MISRYLHFRFIWLFYFLLVTLTSLPLLTFPCVYDDIHVISENALLGNIQSFSEFWLGRVDSLAGLDGAYRPLFLTWLSAIEAINPMGPLLHRLISFALHTSIGALLWLLLTEAMNLPKKTCFFAVAIFLIHPIHHTHLDLIWKQSDLWIYLFFLLSLRALSAPDLILQAATIWLLAIFTKESALVFPLLWLISDPLFPKDSRIKRIKLIAICTTIAGFYYYYVYHVLLSGAGRPSETPQEPLSYLYSQGSVLASYLKNIFVPTQLTIDSDLPWQTFPTPSFVIAALSVLGLLGLSLYFWTKKRSAMALILLWGLGFLIPTSSFHPLSLIYDETRVYLFALVPALAFVFISKAPLRIPALALFLFWSICSFLDIGRWSSSQALWASALSNSPNSIRAIHNLAFAYEKDNRCRDAIPLYERAISLQPTLYQSYNHLGLCLGKLGKLNEAASWFRKVPLESYDYAYAQYYLGLSYAYHHDFVVAESTFRQIEKLNPVLFYKGMAISKELEGHLSESILNWQNYLRQTELGISDKKVALDKINELRQKRP